MSREHENKEALEVLGALWEYRKVIIIVAILAGIASVITTSFIPEKFKSSAVFFPPAFNSPEHASLQPRMGYNIEADRLIQMAQSTALKDSLIEIFDLRSYYKADTENPMWRERIYKSLDQDITFERTKYMSVVVTCVTRDSELSAEIANEVIALLSRFWERLFKQNIMEPLSYSRKMYLEQNHSVMQLLDSIHMLRFGNKDKSLDIMYKHLQEKEASVNKIVEIMESMRQKGAFYDYGAQLDELQIELVDVRQDIAKQQGTLNSLRKSNAKNDTMISAMEGKLDGSKEAEKLLLQRLKILQDAGKNYEALSDKLEIELEQYQQAKQEYERLLNSFEPNIRSLTLENLESRYNVERQMLNDLKIKYEEARRYYNQPLPNLFVVEHAKVSFKKYSPSYRLNLLISVVVSVVITSVIILIVGRIRMIS